MRRHWILAICLSFVCAHAQADTAPIPIGDEKNTCQQFTMCAAQTLVGDCTVLPASGDEIVLETFGRWSSLTFYANQSVGAYSCVVHSNASGHDAETGDFVLLSSTPLSGSNESISLNGGNFGYIWINCPTIGTSVTVTLNACPSNR